MMRNVYEGGNKKRKIHVIGVVKTSFGNPSEPKSTFNEFSNE
jgi:hypothetical protein